MTKFVFLESERIKINSVVLKKDTVAYIIKNIYNKFPPPKRFTIKEIDVEYSDKTIRSIIDLCENMNYIMRVESKKKIPYIFTFMRDLNEINIHWENMGNTKKCIYLN